MDSAELSDLARRYLDLQARIADLEAAKDAIAAKIRAAHDVGAKVDTPDGIRVTVRANRRFDPDRAVEVLTPAQIDDITERVVSAKAARSALSPALYEQCMTDRGDPSVIVKEASS